MDRKSAATEDSGEYRITRSKAWGPGRKIRKVIFRRRVNMAYKSN